MELLTVLAIISLIGGISAGAFHIARRNYALSATASRVEGVLRSARNAAVASGVPSRVVLETDPPAAVAYGFEVVGEWSFEDEGDGAAIGARGAPARYVGSAGPGPGHVGRGFDPSGAYADCGAMSAYDFRAGVYAEAWIRWSGEGGGGGVTGKTKAVPAKESGRKRVAMKETRKEPAANAPKEARKDLKAKGPKDSKKVHAVKRRPLRPVLGIDIPKGDAGGILAKGDAWFLGVGLDGALEGRIGTYRVRTDPGAVAPGRWTRISLTFDGEEIVLSSNGVERDVLVLDRPGGEEDAPPPPKTIPASSDPLTIGSPSNPFSGSIDEVRVAGMVEPFRFELGGREKLFGWKKVIRFDGRGRLDPRRHETPVDVLLYEEDDRPAGKDEVVKTTVAVDFSVTFEEWAERLGLVPDEAIRLKEEARLLAKLGEARRIGITVEPSGALR
jgi:hypothetical protein